MALVAWTIDLCDVAFHINTIANNENQKPLSMICVDQVEVCIIIDGMMWVDQGEQWPQFRMAEIESSF